MSKKINFYVTLLKTYLENGEYFKAIYQMWFKCKWLYIYMYFLLFFSWRKRLMVLKLAGVLVQPFNFSHLQDKPDNI